MKKKQLNSTDAKSIGNQLIIETRLETDNSVMSLNSLGSQVSLNEKQLRKKLERKNVQIAAEINECLDYIRSLVDVDINNRRLTRLRTAKIGISSLIRAMRKDDYLLLQGDHIAEIDMAKFYIPKIDNYGPMLRAKRADQQKALTHKFKENREMKDGRKKPKTNLPRIGSTRSAVNHSIEFGSAYPPGSRRGHPTTGSQSHRG